MIKLISDTSTLYSPSESSSIGVDILPLSVIIGKKTYREYSEMTSENLLEEIKQGAVPSSSQPSVGEVIEHYEKYADYDIVNICMADGLSGTYLSSLGAKEGLANQEHIHVFNSRTLCGPHRYMVECAAKMVQAGCSLEALLKMLEEKANSTMSFLLPMDFEFLKRGGRLTPLAAKIGGMLKIQPVMMQTSDGRRLEKFAISRTFNGAVQTVIKKFQELSDPTSYRVSISHAFAKERALKIKEAFLHLYPQLNIDLLELSPVFITQGGPGCVAIQWILN